MTLKRDSANSVVLRKGKKRRKRKQNEISEEIYFWCSVTPGEVTNGCFSWWGEIHPLTLPWCSFHATTASSPLAQHVAKSTPREGEPSCPTSSAPPPFLGLSKRGNFCCSHSAGARPVCCRCAVSSKDGVEGGPAA